MGLDPAMGGEVHRDAGGEQHERDGKRAGDPGDSMRPLRMKKSRMPKTRTSTAASAKNDEQRRELTTARSEQPLWLAGGGLFGGIAARGGDEAEACGV